MESFVLVVKNKEHIVCLPTAMADRAEKQLGFSILEAMDNAASVSTQKILLWAGLQKLDHGITLEKVCDLMDEMRDGFTMDGKEFPDFSIEARTKLCMKILTVGGFFTADTREQIDARIAEIPSDLQDS